MNSANKTRGIMLIIASVLILLFGIGFFIFFLVQKVRDLTAGMERFPMPGSVRVNLEEAGKYSIFHEYKGTYDGKRYHSPRNIAGLELGIKEKKTGRDIQLKRPTASKTYSFSNSAGYGIYDFEIQQPGEYIFTGKFKSGKGNKVILAVTHGFTARIMKVVVSGLLLLFITIILAVATLVYGILSLIKKQKPGDGEIYRVE
ncbi:MAG: hypothetical protein K8T10_12280 [Candidatus Eremiobacteraeota bacterium]|nr:hypothetical protein [Candidatus Eremiobacteraeota bacterium]